MANDVTGRDDYIIAQALYVAIKTLRQAEFPQESNIEDMQAILRSRYPGQWEHFELEHYLKLAYWRGYRPQGSVTGDNLKRWLAENPETGQVLPPRPIS